MTAATEDWLPGQTHSVLTPTVLTPTVLTPTVPTPTVPTPTVPTPTVPTPTVLTPTMQSHRIFIQATPLEIWDALTRPGWTQLYGYRTPRQYDMRPGGAYRAFASVGMKMRGIDGVVIEGEVLEADAPRRLVQTWHVLFDAATRAEGGTRLTWEIAEGHSGVSTLTLTHDLAGAPSTAALAEGRHPVASGGWAWILSDLKTLLETGRPLAA